MFIVLMSVTGHEVFINPLWVSSVTPHTKDKDVTIVTIGHGGQDEFHVRDSMSMVLKKIKDAYENL
jgi:hypothetical protein